VSSIIKSEKVIKESLEILANKINKDYKDIDVIDIICFVNGASIFCSDLIKLINIPTKLHYFKFSMYQDLPSNGEVQIDQDVTDSLQNKHILLLEGLVISGRTPLYLYNFFKLRNPASIKFCAVGIKKETIQVELNVDYHMFNFQDEWVEGYGIGNMENKILPCLVNVRED